jgi:hypothetical protein
MDGYDVMMAQAVPDGPSSQTDIAALMNKVISN